MAPLKKRISSIDFMTSSSPSSSSSTSVPSLKRLKATTETFVSSSIVMSAATELTSVSPVQYTSSPDDRAITSSHHAKVILCSAGSVTRNCPIVNTSPPVFASRISLSDDGRKNKRKDEANPIPRCVMLPPAHAIDISSSMSTFSTLPEGSHQGEKMYISHQARHRVSIPPLPFTRNERIVSGDCGNSTTSTLSSYEHGTNPLFAPSLVSSRVARSTTRLQEAKLGIFITTTKRGDSEECYLGERHVITGHRHGRGIMTYPNGCQYSGEFVNNMRQGQGKCWYPRDLGVYTGEWHQNDKHGYGSMVYANDDVYNGTWHRNHHSGKGTLTMKGGTEVYSGDFAHNKKHGRGVLRYANGNVYSGTWSDDVRHGEGLLIFANGTSSRCVYCHGKLVFPIS
ncbi:hypothetical protein ACHAXA_007933 [Cyclostephanos tholiformis]|uniref:Uncharacterized protein n=1 Tax=Cyclostephanos tholiformis TaxID=382380 RepID=A0ABD3RAT2_9STRA